MNAGDMAIVAVSSPPGRSYRGLVRMSGPSLGPLCQALLVRPIKPRCLTPGRLGLPPDEKPGHPSPASEDRLHDLPVLALFMPGPHTFTGEDVLEIQAPGNPVLLDRLVRRLIDQADRLTIPLRRAEAGEFTQRAFLAGRLDLAQAEGIAATISAVTDAELAAAELLRAGRLGQWASSLVNELAEARALVEAGIDFVDQEDVVAIAPGALEERLAAIGQRIDQLFDRCGSWAELQAVPWVVLAGRPNVGKSTLFNKLLGRPRAVAGVMPGTTRDVLCEPWRLQGGGRTIEVMLADVAGLDHAIDQLDVQMQQAARAAIRRADLLIWLDDADQWPSDAAELAQENATTLRVRTKADLEDDADRTSADLNVSAKTGTGMDELRRLVIERIGHRAATTSGQMLVLGERHREAIVAAADHLADARSMLGRQRGADDLDEPELIASHLRLALDQLGHISGKMTPDDLLGRVFSTFCVGK